MALRLAAAALGLLTVTFAIVVILSMLQTAGIKARNKALVLELRTQRHELDSTIQKLAQAEERLAALAQGRIPDLFSLTVDQATQFEAGIVQNIIFSLVGVGAEKSYEYRIVLRNEGKEILEPNVKILLFDELGIQIGSALVPGEEDGASGRATTLEPQETRSYVGGIPQRQLNEPKYFLLIDKSKDT